MSDDNDTGTDTDTDADTDTDSDTDTDTDTDVYGSSSGKQFKAFAADSTTSAASRISYPSGPNWVRVDGVVVADSAADFLSVNWNVYNNLKLEGGNPSWAFVWVGSNSPSAGATNDCLGWTSNDSEEDGRIGSGSSFNNQFIYNNMACNRTDMRLYCVEDNTLVE